VLRVNSYNIYYIYVAILYDWWAAAQAEKEGKEEEK